VTLLTYRRYTNIFIYLSIYQLDFASSSVPLCSVTNVPVCCWQKGK